MSALKNLDLVAKIATYIRDRIQSGEFGGGSRVFEAQLARELGVSRTPVREAARLLESEGLLVSRPNRGFAVRQMSVREFIDVSEFRIVIESRSIEKVCLTERRGRVADKLDVLLGVIMTEAREGDRTSQIQADQMFHRALVESAGNSSMLRAYDHLTRDLQTAFRMMRQSTSDWNAICESHQPVIDAVRQGTAKQASKAIEWHLKLAWNDTLDELSARMDAPLIA